MSEPLRQRLRLLWLRNRHSWMRWGIGLLSAPLLFPLVLVWALALPLAFLLGAVWRGILRRRDGRLKVAFLAYQPIRNAGSRFRIYRLAEALAPRIDGHILPPCSDRVGDRIYVPMFYGENPATYATYLIWRVFPRRLWQLLRCCFHDVVVLQYELINVGPMWLEYLLTWLHPRVIYDFDDSLQAFPRYARWLPRIIPRCAAVVVGNDYLREYAAPMARRLVVVPTGIDLDRYASTERPEGEAPGGRSQKPVLGWTGNPANLEYLEILRGPLQQLARTHEFRFLVISAGPYRFAADGVDVEHREWSLADEVNNLKTFDIGLMPVKDDKVGIGKCGFKAIQYMACGIPVLASPVGVNDSLVCDGETGYLCRTPEDWLSAMRSLLEDPELRQRLGNNGLAFVERTFAISRLAEIWMDLLLAVGRDQEMHLCADAFPRFQPASAESLPRST